MFFFLFQHFFWRLKKRSEKTEIARPKRKHRKRKREGESVRADSQPPPPGLETCSSSRRRKSRVWGTNKTRISRNFEGFQGNSRKEKHAGSNPSGMFQKFADIGLKSKKQNLKNCRVRPRWMKESDENHEEVWNGVK